MDENHIFYSTFKNQITDIVSIIAEVFVSLLKLDTDKIKSIVFSSDKRGINYFDIDLTIMTIITIKHLFNEERIKDLFKNSNMLKGSQKTNLDSLEKIIKLLAPLKEEKIKLYYNLIKTVYGNHKGFANNKPTDTSKNTAVLSNLDQYSSRNENYSTHYSLTSNNIVVDSQENKWNSDKQIGIVSPSRGI